MGSFLEQEKLRQTAFKMRSLYISEDARAPGIYRGKARPFVLPREAASQNLFPGIREAAPSFFDQHKIKWHDGQKGDPSNHLCDSQVCCVNFLFPFAKQPEALADLLRPVIRDLRGVLPVEDDHYVSFEWIGDKDHLGEKDEARNKRRSRGANCTSADAVVLVERDDKTRHMVLIEWKYTETYSATPYHLGPSGRRRLKTYLRWLTPADSPIERLADYSVLFYEPIYQLMRQQLLAEKMERAAEHGASIVSVLHIAPECNKDFLTITSPDLKPRGTSVTALWGGLVRNADRFRSISTEMLFGTRQFERSKAMSEWWQYITQRYSWVVNSATHGAPKD
jgi:hypothetical protein